MREDDRPGCGLFQSRTGLALLVFGAVAAFFLIAEHQAHLWGWLPYLLLLACPLMHIFMHGGNGGHEHQHGRTRDQAAQDDQGVDRDRQSQGREGDHA